MKLHINLLLIALALIFFFTSCEHTDVENQDSQLSHVKEYLSNYIRSLEKKGRPDCINLAESIKQVLRMLEVHGEYAVTSVPNPYAVSVGKVGGGPARLLVIYYLEHDTDVVAVRIREYWQTGDSFSEVYELHSSTLDMLHRPSQGSWVNALSFAVTERKSPTVRKDEEKWHEWVCGTDHEGLQPPLYVARPTDKNHVLISLIDKIGHESRAVPLIAWAED